MTEEHKTDKEIPRTWGGGWQKGQQLVATLDNTQ